MVIWDKKDYLMEVEETVSCKETYEEVSMNPLFPLKLFMILSKMSKNF